MKHARTLLVIAAIAAGGAVPAASEAQSRWLTAPAGAGAGLAAGGYITLTVIVAQARMGTYVLEIEDLFDWRSLPPLIGAGAGAALGWFDPPRLMRTALAGAGGTAIGTGLGAIVGGMIWQDSEGRWAGAAIGAGTGLVIGSLAGMLWPSSDEDAWLPFTASVPLVTIPLN